MIMVTVLKWNTCVIWFYNSEMITKGTDEVANNVDPDQTAH